MVGPRSASMSKPLNLRLPLLLIFLFCCGPLFAFTIGDTPYIEYAASSGSFPIAANGHASPIYVDTNDDPGVVRAAHDLQADICRVISSTPDLTHGAPFPADVILIGTIGSSKIIEQLIRNKKIDVDAIRGKWESNLIQVVAHPLPGVASALVIAGSDKRGTIFGIYDVSEQIGVSPWYWWADVPVAHRDALYVKPGRYIEGEPASGEEANGNGRVFENGSRELTVVVQQIGEALLEISSTLPKCAGIVQLCLVECLMLKSRRSQHNAYPVVTRLLQATLA